MLRYILIFMILISNNALSAVKVVQCEDEEGNISFHSNCPPGYKLVGEKKLKTSIGSPAKKNPKDIHALVFIGGDNCIACEDVKEYLSNRQINLTVKDATSDPEVQKELSEITGNLTVPATKIGQKVTIGYKRDELQSALEAEGYEEPKDD